MNYRLKLALGCMLTATVSAPSYAVNLLEVYERALQADPVIRQADANRLATYEGKPQAVAALLPQLNAAASYTKTQTDGTQPPTFSTPTSIGFSSDATGKSYRITLSQSLFHWDQWVALKRADAQVAQAEAVYMAAEQDLIVRVMQRYFSVLSAQDNVDNTQAAAEAFARQLEQAEKRFEVGLIAITDVQEARAQRDRSTADVIDAKRVLATNIELLREITGEEFRTLAAPGDDMPLKSPDPASEDKWVSAALEKNLALIASRLGADIANENVRVARAGHLPSLDLTASYSNSQTDTTTTLDNVGTLPLSTSESKPKQIGLSLTFPIYSGGATQSRVRQQVYLYRAAREGLEQTTRQTERAVRDNYLGVLSGISRVQALKQALDSSKTALQATEAGFEVGTRTTVDVLLSRQNLFAAQTAYSQSRYTYLQSLVLLEQAAGQLSKDDVEEINGWLK